MKNFLLLGTILAAISSCKGPDIELPPTPPSEIHINETELTQNFVALPSEKTISVWSDYGWQAEGDEYATWLSITPYPADRKLTLKTQTNRIYRSRSTEVRLFNNTDSKTITVNQAGTTEYIATSASSIRPPISIGITPSLEKGTAVLDHEIDRVADQNPNSYFYCKFDQQDYAEIKFVLGVAGIPAKYIVFTPPSDIKDRPFSRMKLSYKVSGSDEIIEYLDTTLVQGSNAPFIINYPPKKATELICRLYSTEIGGENIAALAELAVITDMQQSNYYKPFTDETCTTLEAGTTSAQIDNMKIELFMANMAHYVLNGKYPENRLRDISATAPVLTPSADLPNATGFYFKSKETHAIFVGDTHGRNLSLRIVDTDSNPVKDLSFPLHEGGNLITLKEGQGGYGFIRYEKLTDEEYPDIFVNIASGDEEKGW